MPEDHRWLTLHLEAPLIAFGGVRIDHIGITRDFPALSMMTGLLANALGYRRTDWKKHQELQERLVFAARRDRENPAGLLTDTQNARLEKNDRGWTTWGEFEKRGGGDGTYKAPHRRLRDYHTDAHVVVVLRLRGGPAPDLDTLAEALAKPARPLFIGRKPCLPAGPLLREEPFVHAATAHDALRKIAGAKARAFWPLGEGPETGSKVDRIVDLPDIRNWRTGLHGGARKVVEGRVVPEGLAA
ncbi:type I-E CRISPR-associated protein Cas5/CasD [Chelativorans sp. Marseille-P2723]|uniref:type I-E CRISPR-associated protein Cas5/CasD n=1 Tax=Chelativorans sp. Marseille-P2723 TaxID=2709133 RepID=UPI001570346C|nr:type I-E CRISPR-associated protein Cas5/CasD [Chelativorans sp. Marseille-P2723]